MKKLCILITIIASVLIVITCKKFPEMKIYRLEICDEVCEAGSSSAVITARYDYPTDISSISLIIDNNNDMEIVVDAVLENSRLQAVVKDLMAQTKYYYCYRYSNGVNIVETDKRSFITAEATIPVVETLQPTDIGQTTTTLGGNVIDNGGVVINERGICWSDEENPTIDNAHLADDSGSAINVYTIVLNELEPNTMYHVRAYAINNKGIGYGDDVAFMTLEVEGLPTVTTSFLTEISNNQATVSCTVNSDGGFEVTERGACWSTEPLPTVDSTHLSSGTGIGVYTITMTDLRIASEYHVRAYAINAQGISYGNELTFTTIGSLATVTTKSVTDVTEVSAKCGGNVTDDGGCEVTAKGVCWSTEHEPTISDNHSVDGTGNGEFNSDITDLTADVTYYVRAYATNEMGTAYGEEVSFTTNQSIVLPTVSTRDITNIGVTSATGGGYVIDAGNGTLTGRGVCWSTSQNPTTSDSHTSNGSSMGSYISYLTDLQENTTYYVRAYARNEAGTAYGAEVIFTTNHSVILPTVVTSGVSDITPIRATVSGQVTDAGYGSITKRGVCWSTDHNPTTDDNHTVENAGTGYFTSDLTCLRNNTLYYVRAYATNQAGTAYSEEISFTTLDYTQPPTGALSGLFTYNANCEKLYFSKGNLQYRASTNTWRFADNQWDYVGSEVVDGGGDPGGTVSGSSNHLISSTYDGWIDLFGWATSGYNHNSACYQPYSTSTQYCYYAYGDESYNLYDQTGQADWGYNAISNGGNTENIWRTLTKEEWNYLFWTRNTDSGIRFAKASVNGVCGLILLPDDWNTSYYTLYSTNSNTANYTTNVISLSAWNANLEANGAVFLPAGGHRYGYYVYLPNRGRYWSSSTNGGNAWGVWLGADELSVDGMTNYPFVGQNIRLVHNAEY